MQRLTTPSLTAPGYDGKLLSSDYAGWLRASDSGTYLCQPVEIKRLSILLLYTSTLVVFLALDVVGIKLLVQPLFSTHVGHLLLEDFRLGAAVVFYLFYIAALLWFVSVPAFKADSAFTALWNGALLGLLCYGTYEFTNYATLADWRWPMVVVDSLWGMVLTGFSAWAGVAITRLVQSA